MGPRIVYETPSGTLEAATQLHPKGCMGARQEHVDAPLPRGLEWLLDFFSRGGHRVPARKEGGCLIADLHELLGIPLLVRLCPSPWRTRRLYIMASRSRRLYLAPA